MIQIKIDYWKDTGKWYTTEEILIRDLMEDVPGVLLSKFKGMTATVSYLDDEDYIPYRMYKL